MAYSDLSLSLSLSFFSWQAYFFEDNDSDDQSVSDISPLIRRPTSQSSSTPHTHIVTGYLSAVEALLLVSAVGPYTCTCTCGQELVHGTCNYVSTASLTAKVIQQLNFVAIFMYILQCTKQIKRMLKLWNAILYRVHVHCTCSLYSCPYICT